MRPRRDGPVVLDLWRDLSAGEQPPIVQDARREDGRVDAVADRGSPPPLDECAAPKPDWIFCDSFESGKTWDGSLKNPVLVTDPGPRSLPGNHAMQLRTPAGASGGKGVWKSLPSSDKLYARWYTKWEPGYTVTALHHGPGGLGAYYRGMYQDCANPNGACWGDSFPCVYDAPGVTGYCKKPEDRPKVTQPAYQNDRWYCIEQYIDAGTPVSSGATADGVLDFWIDGVEVGPWSKMWWRTVSSLKVNFLWLYLYNHDGTHSVPGLLVDNVVVSKSRIGCL